MKRRRKAKKGAAKKPRVVGASDVPDNVVTQNDQENFDVDEFDNDESDSEKESESPSSLATDPPEKPAPANPGVTSGATVGQLVYRRVKVKIKTSTTLDSQLTSSDAPTRSNEDKSGQPIMVGKLEAVSRKMEDSVNTLPETNTAKSSHLSKSPGSIKISMSPSRKAELMKGQNGDQRPELLSKEPQVKKQELDASLEVIKKVMKMDAAESFNVPVNPIALGIPDYFDVIDTPMDFGTICSNLESGTKYRNSADVYRDVQHIWDNCFKYNNKGDYILELMKRVKKNFLKYWMSAGLFCDHPEGSNSADTIQVKDVTPSVSGKTPGKSDSSTPSTKKSHGLKKHKDGCMCAICVMIRRRQEREENARMLEDQTEASEDYGDDRVKAEEMSPIESAGRGYTSSNIENSMEQDGNPDLEERGEEMNPEDSTLHLPTEKGINGKENEMTDGEKEEGELSDHPQSVQASQEDSKCNHELSKTQIDDVSHRAHAGGALSQHGNDAAVIEGHKTKETMDKGERAKMYERLRYLENSKLFELCGNLFDEKNNSIWSGPHSLVRKENATRKSSIISAVTSFMK